MAASGHNRRRQRSVRVTVALALLAFAALFVLAALPTQSPIWLSLSSVGALFCGCAASRIVYSELRQSRREAAADRAAQAHAYRSMFTERATEHAEFTTAMTDRLASRERAIGRLEDTLVHAERRAVDAETRVTREATRAEEAMVLVSELQEALETVRAEDADELAVWEGDAVRDGHETEADPVIDLLAWEENRPARTAPGPSAGREPGRQSGQSGRQSG